MRILIAEDNPIYVLMLQNILKDDDLTVVVATNGTAAWDVLQESEPPLIAILDWMMPGINGVELCRKIRADPTLLSRVYVIILSSIDGKDEIAMGLEAGANDYITKPFSNLELSTRVAVGMRIARLEKTLVEGVDALEKARIEITQLKQFLPACPYCAQIPKTTRTLRFDREIFLESGMDDYITPPIQKDKLFDVRDVSREESLAEKAAR